MITIHNKIVRSEFIAWTCITMQQPTIKYIAARLNNGMFTVKRGKRG